MWKIALRPCSVNFQSLMNKELYVLVKMKWILLMPPFLGERPIFSCNNASREVCYWYISQFALFVAKSRPKIQATVYFLKNMLWEPKKKEIKIGFRCSMEFQWLWWWCWWWTNKQSFPNIFIIGAQTLLCLFFLSHFILLCSRVIYLSLILHNNCEFLGGRDYGLFISIFSLAPLVSLGNGLFISFNRYWSNVYYMQGTVLIWGI